MRSPGDAASRTGCGAGCIGPRRLTGRAGRRPARILQASGALKSPMVGTAYLGAQPGDPPFVEMGSKVTQGQTILIIEAMKTMNHIPAPKAGVVTAILVGNGQPVEFGEPLAIIE
jgi:acetyl-CoA carboxylase biotin carboxyl carrier protein